VPLRRPVRLHYARFQDFIEAATHNISESGMFIQTTVTRPPGAEFDFRITLADGLTLIEGLAEVAWVSTDDSGSPNGMGVRFLDLVGDSTELVRRVVAQNREEGVIPFELSRRP